MTRYPFLLWALINPLTLLSQTIALDASTLEPVHVSMRPETWGQRQVVRVVKDPAIKEVDEPTFVNIRGSDFTNGTLEVYVLSRLLPTAPEAARGFIGIAFRIAPDRSRFECIYLRPTNGRAEDQLRRNRATQYFSFPDFKFDRLRRESPGQYESYADMGLNEWIKIKIDVTGRQAKLYVNDSPQPVLVVNDLKHGDQARGSIGLWVDVGTEGFFSDLKIMHTP
ncbi:MAG: hypothetical protein MUC38_12955 [Cyclobacteriaceae bacterium]|jgi:hypothetical protein|nr:hypothetical protein [Cyclobacteriaceae bacterium]